MDTLDENVATDADHAAGSLRTAAQPTRDADPRRATDQGCIAPPRKSCR